MPENDDRVLSRLSRLETRVESQGETMARLETEQARFHEHMGKFERSSEKINESLERMKSIEFDVRRLRDDDVRSVREKIAGYEVKFQSMEKVERLSWMILLALIPVTGSLIVEGIRYALTIKP